VINLGGFGCKLTITVNLKPNLEIEVLLYPVLPKERSIAKNRVNGSSVLPEREDLKGEELVSWGRSSEDLCFEERGERNVDGRISEH
jgi:hypothetical protein